MMGKVVHNWNKTDVFFQAFAEYCIVVKRGNFGLIGGIETAENFLYVHFSYPLWGTFRLSSVRIEGQGVCMISQKW